MHPTHDPSSATMALPNAAANAVAAAPGGWLKRWTALAARLAGAAWQADIRFARTGWRRAWLVLAALAGIALWLWPQDLVSDFSKLRDTPAVRIFYMVPDLPLAGLTPSLGELLVWIGIGRALFVIVIGLLDMALYRRVTGRPFDWESMVNIALVNAFFMLAGVFVLLNEPMKQWLHQYEAWVAHVPTLVDLNGTLALVVAALIGDFCFYWSHRVCHGRRFFWNLGHIHHHRNRGLTQLTCAIEPPLLPLQAAGGLAALLLPPLAKLFTTDIHQAGIALVVLMLVDTWTDPSHSTTMYWLEARSRVLRSLRWVFVTVGVHFMHHSRAEGPRGTGCNFGARLTVWDRLFGTYVEPSHEIPETGLFDPQADACINPVRYLLLPYVRVAQELKRNRLREWPAILFGRADYEPPNPVEGSR